MTDDRTVKAVLTELKKAVRAKGKVVIDAYSYDAEHTVNVDSFSNKRADELEAVCKALAVSPYTASDQFGSATLLV